MRLIKAKVIMLMTQPFELMKKLFAVFFFFVATLSTLHAQTKLIFVMRVDDVMSRNTAYQPRSLKPLEQAAEARGAKVTWVTIPNRLIESANSNGVLKRELQSTLLRGHEISLHGYTHICQRCNQSSHEMYCTTFKSPFTYDQQKKLVIDGLKILADSIGVRPLSFVSPGHIEDSTTYKVLLDHGFKWISTASAQQNIYRTLQNLGVHNEYTWQMTAGNYTTQLKAALKDIRQKAKEVGYFCMYQHDPFIRQGYENGIVPKWTGELLDSLKAEYGSNLQFMTLSQAAEYFANQTSVAATNNSKIPLGFALYQNFPNPFWSEAASPATTIKYRLPERSQVQLDIFDLSGRNVATLELGLKERGEHVASWNALNRQGQRLAGGVYFYSLRVVSSTGNTVTLKQKLTILK